METAARDQVVELQSDAPGIELLAAADHRAGLARVDGRVLHGPGGPFHEASARLAEASEVAAWLADAQPPRASLTVGRLTFAPDVPLWLILAVAILGGALAVWGVWRGLRGAWLRLAAVLALALALANPAVLVEEREPLRSVVAVVSDMTGSQKLDGRDEATEEGHHEDGTST